MKDKVYAVAVIGGGSAGVMALLRVVLNNDECLFFPGYGKNRKKSRGFWVAKVENVPGYAHYKKGIEDPNRETLKWISESPVKDKFHWKKNHYLQDLSSFFRFHFKSMVNFFKPEKGRNNFYSPFDFFFGGKARKGKADG